MSTKHQRPPPALRKLLDLDIALTRKFTIWANQFVPLKSLRIHYKLLEVSCHGVPWFAFWIAFTWLFNNPSLIQMQVNMLLGLIIDVIFVAPTKAYVRRRRPIANKDDKLGQMGPDKFSFPSGHASRCVLVAYFFIYLYPVSMIFYPPLIAWATSVSLSRILLNRHYILDVVAGVCLGLFEGYLLGLLWLSNDTAVWLMSMISDDNWSGGEYHV